MTYSEKLKDPKWQRLRLLIFERDKWTCQSCGRTDLPLNIHHIKYISGKDPWEYEEHFLITYCEVCHETEHLIGTQIHESLIDIIKANPPLIQPMSQLCILCEKFGPFRDALRKFLAENLMIYLQEMKNQTNVEKTSVPILPR